MPNAVDYTEMPDGTLKRQNPSTINPTVKSDGWMDKELETVNKNPSHLITSPRKLIILSATEILEMPAPDIGHLWKPFIYEKSIHILNSVAGIGKTTLCYNLAVSGAKGEPFANIQVTRPINILYADLETGIQLGKTKLSLISDNTKSDNLYFVYNLDFIANYEQLKQEIVSKSIDLLIVDTINEAFNTRDEQDNSEANRQSASIRRLRDNTGCAILLIAHMGKGEPSHKVYSTRGASARSASVDVVLNLTEETDNVVCLSKEKDRIGGGKEKLYLRRAGEDSFEVIERQEDLEVNLLIKVEKHILQLTGRGYTQTSQFIEQGKKEGYSQPTIERAISNLRKAGDLIRVKKGVYKSKGSEVNGYSFFGGDFEDNGHA